MFLENYFKDTGIGKMLNAVLFIIVVSKELPNFKNRILVKWIHIISLYNSMPSVENMLMNN